MVGPTTVTNEENTVRFVDCDVSKDKLELKSTIWWRLF